jgi:hypothetical protein
LEPPLWRLSLRAITSDAAVFEGPDSTRQVASRVTSNSADMSDHPDSIDDPNIDLAADPGDSPTPGRLLTPAAAAQATGLSRKQITGRMDRGSLRVIKDAEGTRRVPRAELVRVGLLAVDGSPSHSLESPNESGDSAGELVIWRDLYERERQERADAEAERAELQNQLAAIANAGPIRAMRLRRQVRQQLEQTAVRTTSARA